MVIRQPRIWALRRTDRSGRKEESDDMLDIAATAVEVTPGQTIVTAALEPRSVNVITMQTHW